MGSVAVTYTSNISNILILRTANILARIEPPVPCAPRLSNVEIDCLANSAWVMYEESAGAEDYVVLATDGQGNVQSFECNSTLEGGVCSLPPLMCSQNLTFTLKALDQQCSSAPSNAITTETGKLKMV